jgi:hypothetical protein
MMNEAMKETYPEQTSLDCQSICLVDVDGDGIPDVATINLKWLFGSIVATVSSILMML